MAPKLTAIPEHNAASPAVPQLKKARRFIVLLPLFKDFALLLLESLHRDGSCWAPVGTESTPDAFFFVLNDGSCLAELEFRGADTIPIANQGVVWLVAADLREINESQAAFRANIDASGTQNAL